MCKVVLFLLCGVGMLALAVFAWMSEASSTGAQEGAMHNCPAAGKWSIAVWDGESGTAAADALATCGAGAVDAAYSLDPQTQGWWRWFAANPDVSNLPPLNDMQGVIALGGTGGPVQTPQPTATPTPWPPSNTAAGSVLAEGETWYQDGVALTLVSAELNPGGHQTQVGFEFRLENLTDLDLVLDYNAESFEIRNSVGEAFDVFVNPQSFLLEPGEIGTLNKVQGEGDIVSSSVTTVTIRVLSLSRIVDARWSIPVYH